MIETVLKNIGIMTQQWTVVCGDCLTHVQAFGSKSVAIKIYKKSGWSWYRRAVWRCCTCTALYNRAGTEVQ